MSMASCTSPRASLRTFPISRVIARAYSSFRSRRICAEAVEDLAPLRARHEPPAPVGLGRRVDGVLHVALVRVREPADQVGDVGRVAVLESFPERAGTQALDEVFVDGNVAV